MPTSARFTGHAAPLPAGLLGIRKRAGEASTGPPKERCPQHDSAAVSLSERFGARRALQLELYSALPPLPQHRMARGEHWEKHGSPTGCRACTPSSPPRTGHGEQPWNCAVPCAMLVHNASGRSPGRRLRRVRLLAGSLRPAGRPASSPRQSVAGGRRRGSSAARRR